MKRMIVFLAQLRRRLLGLALFTRIPAVLAIGAAVAASLLAHVSGHRARAGFLITLAAWIAAAGFYYTTQLRPYFSRPITYLQSLAVDSISCCSLRVARRFARCSGRSASRLSLTATRKWLPLALIGGVTVGGLYALFFRESGGRLAVHDAHAVRSFAHLYFTPTGFGVALLGYALIVWRSFWRAPALILTSPRSHSFFLQAADNPRAVLAGPPFPGRHPAICARLRRGRGAPAAVFRLSWAMGVTPWRRRARIAVGLAIVGLLGRDVSPRRHCHPIAYRIRRHHSPARAYGRAIRR